MELNKYIDHTILKAFATEADIEKLCDEAIKYNFMSLLESDKIKIQILFFIRYIIVENFFR